MNSSFICNHQTGKWRRQWHHTPVLSPGKSRGWRSLVGCSPWGHEESDMIGRLHFHFSLSCIGEGNGNPPQCSCLENPRDGGAWWAAVYGVAQSQKRLKWLSGSGSSNLETGFPWYLSSKESSCQCRRCRLDPWIRKILYRIHSSILTWEISGTEEPGWL